MITCNNLTIRYGNTVAVDQLNMVTQKGEKVSVVGASGCGKTSLLHGMAGLLKPASGEVTVHGEKVEDIRQGTAIILQQDGLFPWKNVYDNVSIALLSHNKGEGSIEKGEAEKRVNLVLDELCILELKNRYLHELSGGQRRRVAIARALVQAPDLLLMDEPTGSLDMITKERFQDTLHQLYEQHQMTTVLVTHDIEEAVFLGQKIIVMGEGRILEILDNPYFGEVDLREDLRFYELCLKVRQVMKR